jgi:FtsZ-binding cell division protein ZapB
MAKYNEWSGLLKIPDVVLLKEALKEIGELKSYVEELKYENSQLKQSINNAKKDSPESLQMSIKQLKHNNKVLTKENIKLRTELINVQLKDKGFILA